MLKKTLIASNIKVNDIKAIEHTHTHAMWRRFSKITYTETNHGGRWLLNSEIHGDDIVFDFFRGFQAIFAFKMQRIITFRTTSF